MKNAAIVLVFIGMLHATTIHCHGFLEMEIKINAKQDHNIIAEDAQVGQNNIEISNN